MVVNDELMSLFLTIGLSEQKAKETLKNDVLTKHLKCVIEEAVKHGGSLQQIGTLLYHLAAKVKVQISHFIPMVVEYVVANQIDSHQRIDAALDYLLSHLTGNLNVKDFESACGVGITVSPEEIEHVVEKLIKKHQDELLDKRYRFNMGVIMQEVRQELKWADGKEIKNEVDLQVLDLLGPKTEADFSPHIKQSKKFKMDKSNRESRGSKNDVQPISVNDGEISLAATSISEIMRSKVNFHKPGENYKTDGYVVTPKTMQLLQEHLQLTGGQVRTRFPPEPNGILHIGHAKAININFGYAAAHDGICFLRYDDTNPEKEEEKFFVGIKDMVEWLGG